MFSQKLASIIKKNNSLLCIGLDPDLEKIPKALKKQSDLIFSFNKQIINSTYNLICAYKPNIAYYEAYGIEGLKSLKKTIDYLKSNFKEIPIILDAKRGDIGHTAKMYAKAAFDYYRIDAITINPYLGFDAVKPFLEWRNKGIFVLCRTSNPGSSDFQDTEVSLRPHIGCDDEATHRDLQAPLYLRVAQKITEWNKKYRNCFIVVGATYEEELRQVRRIAPNMFFLVPGIGVQGGNIQKILKNGLRKDKSGLILNISRAIIYADNPKEKAKEYRNLINNYR